MALDSDIQTILNSDWDTTIIAKPTFKTAPKRANQIPNVITIVARDPATLAQITPDNTYDRYSAPFTIYLAQESAANAKLTAKAVKKALHQSTLTNGYYHIDSIQVAEEHNITKYVLQGSQNKILEVTDL